MGWKYTNVVLACLSCGEDPTFGADLDDPNGLIIGSRTVKKVRCVANAQSNNIFILSVLRSIMSLGPFMFDGDVISFSIIAKSKQEQI